MVGDQTHFVFESYLVGPSIRPSFIQIGEVACITNRLLRPPGPLMDTVLKPRSNLFACVIIFQLSDCQNVLLCGPVARNVVFHVIYIYIYTWSYENRVTKHFVIFLNSPCLIACLLRCLLMSFFFACFKWLGNCVEVDVDSITILPTPLPPYFSLPTIQICLTQVTVI